MKRGLGALVRVFVTLAICAGSMGLAIVAFPLADYRSTPERAVPEDTVAVLARTTRQTTPAAVDLAWSARRQVPIGDAFGKITEIFASAGQELQCGAPVVAIDGAIRLAMCGPMPPWRDFTGSTQGPDADQLAELLVGLNLLSDGDRTNGTRRAAAWKQLARSNGFPATATFHPSDVVWIGDATTPTRMNVDVGDRVSADSLLFEVDAALQTATVEVSAGGSVALATRVFSTDGSAVEFPIGAGGSLDAPTFEAVARSTMTDPSAPLPTRLQGITRLASPASYAAIPPSALVTATDGSTCVILENGASTNVTVVDAVTGLVMVDADLPEGTVIRNRPPADTTC